MTELDITTELELEISGFLSDGQGLARHNNQAIFVDQALEGQTVKARIIEQKKNFARAELVEVIKPAPWEISPTCQHASLCGGCTWQAMPYERQLSWKKRFIEDALQRIGKIQNVEVEPVTASPQIWNYRNKMEFAFGIGSGTNAEENFELGLCRKKSHELVNIQNCHLQDPLSSQIVQFVRKFAATSGLNIFDGDQGFWRYLIIRTLSSGCFAEIIGSTQNPKEHLPLMHKLGEELHHKFPNLTSLLYSCRNDKQDLAYGEKFIWQSRKLEMFQKLGPLNLRLGEQSFFQVNTQAAAVLYEKIATLTKDMKLKQVWDIYCGLGSIGLYLAHKHPGLKIFGIEQGRQAIALAKVNAKSLNVEADFVSIPVDKFNFSHKPKPDLIIIDPPRSGLSPKLIQMLLTIKPEHIIYVSCDPASLARDMSRLNLYTTNKIQAIDMFPHTPHVESLTLLSIKK